MTRYRVIPYKPGSRSAKALADALGGRRLRLEGSNFTPQDGDIIINWGKANFVLNSWGEFTLNNPTAVALVGNKLQFFQHMQEKEYVPNFWTTQTDIPDDAFPVVCRRVLSGHSGAGIHIAGARSALVDCQLFVQYVKKKHEYRVHVGMRDGEPVVIAVQRKARRNDCEDPDWQVRNLAGGFIYKRHGFTAPQQVIDVAKDCLASYGLDFGAVDVIWNAHQEKAYVLEINTAPGLEGTTISDYASFFQSLAQGQADDIEGD